MPASNADRPTFSIVVPMYNEAGNVVDRCSSASSATVEAIDGAPTYEIVLVNDGSTDGTAERDSRGVARAPATSCSCDLSRNFGHQLAATAGIELARGDAVVLMDGDLQDPPELIAAFVAQVARGLRRRLRGPPYAQRREPRSNSLTAGFVLSHDQAPDESVDSGRYRRFSFDEPARRRRAAAARPNATASCAAWSVGSAQPDRRRVRSRRALCAERPISDPEDAALCGRRHYLVFRHSAALRIVFRLLVSAIAFVYALVVIVVKLFGVYPPATPGLGLDDRRGRSFWAACSSSASGSSANISGASTTKSKAARST